MERVMASVRRVDEIIAIEGADKIEVARIGGWRVVVKKGEFQEGSLAIYCEIDSFIPTEIAPFLTKSGHAPKEYNGVQGERLKTVKLKGQISQGLLLPTKFLGAGPLEATIKHPTKDEHLVVFEGDDVSEYLGIQKWEPPVDAKLGGNPKGNFPNFIRKTDQERIQNLSRQFADWNIKGETWEKTEKLHGSSMTVYVNEDADGVCSRNIDLLPDEGNAYWDVAIRDSLHEIIRKNINRNIAIQGELCGPGINGNTLKLKELTFFVFDIFDIDAQQYLLPEERHEIVRILGLRHVPVVGKNIHLGQVTVDDLLVDADGDSFVTPGVLREGYVYKSMHHHDPSFKVVSNKWLGKYE